MSYQYPQYPNYPNYPQAPAGQAPGAGSSIDLPAAPAAQGVYVPITVPDSAEWAVLQSQQLSNIAAGKPPAQLGVQVPEGSLDYPYLMYKQDGTTKGAKDEKEKADLAGKGYSENPPKPDPNAVTPEMLQALQQVWVKAGEELKRLTQLVDQQQKQMDAASNVLGAGQQPQQDPSLFQQQLQYPTGGQPGVDPTTGYPTSAYPTGD